MSRASRSVTPSSTLPILLVPVCASFYEFTAAIAPFNATPSTLDTWVVK